MKQEQHKPKMVKPTKDEINAAIDQSKPDPTVIALCGRDGTGKSGVLCEFVSALPDDKIAVILDFDHSIKRIRDRFWTKEKSKFIVIDATTCGKDYRKGLLVGLSALEQTIQIYRNKIGLLAVEGMDRLLQRSFRITLQARGYNIEDIRFFGKGGQVTLEPTDWMLRNEYNVDAFDVLYNYASELGVDLILTTHTEDKINNKREVIKSDAPMWFKTIPDYITYRFILKRIEKPNMIERVAVCEKARDNPEMDGMKFTFLKVEQVEGKAKVEYTGLYNQIKDLATLNFAGGKNGE